MSAGAQSILRVDASASGAADGTSWEDAYTDLGEAIEDAAPGDEVWVAAGVYTPTTWPNGGSGPRDVHFTLKNGVGIYGGFTGTETLRDERDFEANETILSGNLGDPETNDDNVQNIFYLPHTAGIDETAILDGFILRDGNATTHPQNSGGGIHIPSGGGAPIGIPTLRNLTFLNNNAESGGGMYLNLSFQDTPTSATFTNLRFIGNSSVPNYSYPGGGLWANAGTNVELHFVNCLFEDNFASVGGGASVSGNVTFDSCTFRDNYSPYTGGPSGFSGIGGGLYIGGGHATVINSLFLGNESSEGGAIKAHAPFVVRNSTFSGNDGSLGASITLTNIGNPGEPVTIESCTFANNYSSNRGSVVFSSPDGRNIIFRNNLVWGNEDEGGSSSFELTWSSGSQISHNIIEGGNQTLIDGGFTGASDIFDIDPQIEELADNGGPTRTHRVPFEGPATMIAESVGGGNWNGIPEEDQRGVSRPTSGMRTLGAFEPEPNIFVDIAATGSGDGTSWADAYTNLQEAIDSANKAQDLWVAAGVYTPSTWPNGGSDPREVHFSLRNGVRLYGGFTGTESSLEERDIAANETILGGDLGGGLYAYSVFNHPGGLNLDTSARLDGFTVRDGFADGAAPANLGGAMRNIGSYPLIANCRFLDNTSDGDGGAIYFSGEGGAASITTSTFAGNESGGNGGAIALHDGSLHIDSSTFSQNVASDAGAGIFVSGSPDFDILNSTISGNTVSSGSTSSGGGLHISSSLFTIMYITFTENYHPVEGGAVSIVDASAGALTHCILWGNSSELYRSADSTGGQGVRRSIIEGGFPGGLQIVDLDPELGPLADNGGPTWTHAIPYTSAAFNAFSSTPPVDQRGEPRATTVRTASGSYEPVRINLQYSINASFGTISGETLQALLPGESGTAVEVIPVEGRYFHQWSDGVTDNPRTDLNVTDHVNVTASVPLIQYTLTYIAGTGGTISGSSIQTRPHGFNGFTVTANPSEGFTFVQWDDDVLTASRQDMNITADITATAIFAPIEYTLTYSNDGNGTINGQATQQVDHGSNGSPVTADPNTGYHFVQWSDESTENPRTDTNVTGNISVTAQFAINTYDLTYSAGANGSLEGNPTQQVDHGSNGSAVEAIPDTGYHFVQWSDESTENPRTDLNVTGNISVTAQFAINTYDLTYSAGANGSLEGNPTQQVDHGSNGSAVEAIPDTGYHFVQWSDESTENPRTDTNVTGNISVTAQFADITAPLSQLLPLEDEVLVGESVVLDFTSSDQGSGVSTTELYVKTPGETGFVATGLVESGESGSFVYTFTNGNGVYAFATVATDVADNTESIPAEADVVLIVSVEENTPVTITVESADSTTTFPMTADLNIVISIEGADPGATITVSRETGNVAPEGMDADKLIDEFLTITGIGLGTGWTATITWTFAPESIEFFTGDLDTVFQVNGNIVTGVYHVTTDGNTITITNVSSFSEWYAGNNDASADDWLDLVD
ncbi:MAG: InlB B-repeat-containing protein [Candidatus Sumerlaeia bacterium]|nr:InlB B-repeat-containing protein [Candidatus Sumerlaeia bacterium]